MKKKFISIDKEAYDQLVELQRRRYPGATTNTELIARHWDEPYPDQVTLDYWYPSHKRELKKLKDSYKKPLS